MLNPKMVNVYGVFAIGIMAVMLFLMLAKVVPRHMYMTLFLIAAALFLVRITLRLVLARQQRQMKKSLRKEEDPNDVH